MNVYNNLNPLFSILIANYNNGHFFKECYSSIISQSYSNWEVIIIDDCSTDNSVEVIRDLIANDSRFVLYKNEVNLKYQKTLKKAIELSSGSIFGRLDPDDCLLENAVENCVTAHLQNPTVGLVYTNCIVCDENLNPLYQNRSSKVTIAKTKFYCLGGEVSHFATFKRSFYNLTSGIDVQNFRAEDKDIYMKLYEVSDLLHLDEDLYLYRIHTNSLSQFQNKNKSFFWFWVAIIKAAERRNENVEDLFYEYFVRKDTHTILLDTFQSSRWIKLGRFLGFLK